MVVIPGIACIHGANLAPILIRIFGQRRSKDENTSDDGPISGLNVGWISIGDPVANPFLTISPIITPTCTIDIIQQKIGNR